jgi:hypothetical protein
MRLLVVGCCVLGAIGACVLVCCAAARSASASCTWRQLMEEAWDAEGPTKGELWEWEWPLGVTLTGTGFMPAGQELRIVTPVAAYPIASSERVALREGDTFIVVRGPEQLAGRVRITSPEAALSYVRLFTSPATVRAMRGPRWIEVAPLSSVDDRYLFGREREDIRDLFPVMWFGYRSLGVLKDREWRDAGLSSPVVLTSADGFIVVRLLFRPDEDGKWWTHTAHWVAETVSPAGEMQRQVIGTVKLDRIPPLALAPLI